MKNLLISLIALSSISATLQAQIFNFKERVYRYALKDIDEGGLKLGPVKATIFTEATLNKPNPTLYFTNHPTAFKYAFSAWGKQGLELPKDKALELADHIANQKTAALYTKTMKRAIVFAYASEKEDGLEYSKEESIAFGRRFAEKDYGLDKLEAYKQLYLFARKKLKMSKEQAIEYAEEFISQH